MKNRKRKITMIAVLLFVCAAVSLNWSYNQRWGKPDAEMVQVMDEARASADAAYAETVATGASAYFAEARLTRQMSRDEALELLQAGGADRKSPDRQGLRGLCGVHRKQYHHGGGPGARGGPERRGGGPYHGHHLPGDGIRGVPTEHHRSPRVKTHRHSKQDLPGRRILFAVLESFVTLLFLFRKEYDKIL